VTLTGGLACEETNLLSESYDPRTDCTCNGLFPVPSNLDIQQFRSQSRCKSIDSMVHALEEVTSVLSSEPDSRNLFPIYKLQEAAEEVILCNSEFQCAPKTCQGDAESIPPVQAPSRKPDLESDTPMHVYNELYPTAEQVKLFADAKYFFAVACGATLLRGGPVARNRRRWQRYPDRGLL